jgi:hypothetical protein
MGCSRTAMSVHHSLNPEAIFMLKTLRNDKIILDAVINLTHELKQLFFYDIVS